MSPLIDSDLLVAAMLKGHPGHARARRWLDRIKPAGWAVAAETYLAAVRLLMNPGVMGSGALSASELVGSHPVEVVLAPCPPSRARLEKTTGNRQIMDAWLVQIARDTGRRLARHDLGLLAKWPEDTLQAG